MTVNNYFQNGKGVGSPSEQALIESTIIEMIQMCGQDFLYIPRTLVNVDPILNEDPAATFSSCKTLEMYCSSFAEFGGQGKFMDKFGFDMDDSMELVVSKKRAYEETGLDPLNQGDLLYWPLTKSFWQINMVDADKSPFYSLSNLYTFTLKCTRFVYGYENFDTGNTAVDAINNTTTAFQKNQQINDVGDTGLDFTEENPFGSVEVDSNGEQGV